MAGLDTPATGLASIVLGYEPPVCDEYLEKLPDNWLTSFVRNYKDDLKDLRIAIQNLPFATSYGDISAKERMEKFREECSPPSQPPRNTESFENYSKFVGALPPGIEKSPCKLEQPCFFHEVRACIDCSKEFITKTKGVVEHNYEEDAKSTDLSEALKKNNATSAHFHAILEVSEKLFKVVDANYAPPECSVKVKDSASFNALPAMNVLLKIEEVFYEKYGQHLVKIIEKLLTS